jgi:peptidoglycan L-alanyl-D-glutamate endopeptidase CwlK
MMSKYKLGKTSQERLEGVDDRLVTIVHLAITETNQDFSVVEGLRSVERQNELFKKGYTELDGYEKQSAHQLGTAVDIAPYRDGKLLWDYEKYPAEWLEVGRAMLRAARKLGVNLEWGLTYNLPNGYDYPHFQLKEING